MACCMVGLLLIYQLIGAWQHCRLWCRTPSKWFAALGVVDASTVQRGRRAVLVVMVALQIGFGSTLVWAHSARVREHAVSMLNSAQAMCRTFGAIADITR